MIKRLLLFLTLSLSLFAFGADLRPAPAPAARFVIEGDSHTTAAQGWPYYLPLRDSRFGRMDFVRYGLDGDTVANMVAEYATQAHLSRPTSITDQCAFTLQAGTNDCIGGTAAATTYANMLLIWGEARNDRYNPVYAYTIPPSNLITGGNETIRVALNALIRGDPSKYDILVDTDVLYPTPGDTDWVADGTHLNAYGHAKLADHVITLTTRSPFLIRASAAHSSLRTDLSVSVPGALAITGAVTGTSFNGLTLTNSTGTITLTNGKTLAVTNSLTLSGTDGTTMTFPTTSATLARTDAANTFTGTQTFSGNTISMSGASPTLSTTTGNIIIAPFGGVISFDGSSNKASRSNGFIVGTSLLYGWSADAFSYGTLDTTLSRNAAGVVQVGTTTANSSGTLLCNIVNLSKTITTGGTTGAQTINKASGTVNFAAGAQTLVVTNSLVTANSIVMAQVEGTNTTAKTVRVTKASGSFTLTLDATATAETAVAFRITN